MSNEYLESFREPKGRKNSILGYYLLFNSHKEIINSTFYKQNISIQKKKAICIVKQFFEERSSV